MYQKMVSYVYEYRDGIRGRNVGFVKLALQNKEFKMKLQLRQTQFTGKVLCVHGFMQEDGKIHTAYLGKIYMQQGNGEGLFAGNGENLWGQRDFLKMNGFLLYPEEKEFSKEIDYFCGAKWDDQPIQWKNMVETEEAEQENMVETVEVEPHHEKNVLHAAELDDSGKRENEKDEEWGMGGQEELRMRSWNEKERNSVKERKQGDERNIGSRQNREIERCCEKGRDEENIESERYCEKGRDEKNEGEMGSRLQEKEDERCINARGENKKRADYEEMDAIKKEKKGVQDEREAWKMFEKRRNNMQRRWQEIKEMREEEQSDWEVGEDILGKFPVLNPFFDHEVVSSVRIEPKDLGNLPMEHWYLANNSFLLHGYYYYRHLLFCKMKNHTEMQYVIAVPGNMEEREQLMANMFGFEQFKRVKNKNQNGKQYGYWWKRIW